MNTDRVSRWLTLGANLAVLASIVFLAIEIRQNTEMTRAQITQGRAENALYLADMQINSDYIPDIVVKVGNGEELTPAERFRYTVYLRATLRNQDNNIQQYNQGLLGEHIPRTISGVVHEILVGNPEGRAYWERSKIAYSDEFVEFVDSVIAETEMSISE